MFPRRLAKDKSGNIFVLDSIGIHQNRIRKIDTASGKIDAYAGTGNLGFSGDGGPAISAQLDQPTDLAFDAQGNLYVNDVRNGRIRKISSAEGILPVVFL